MLTSSKRHIHIIIRHNRRIIRISHRHHISHKRHRHIRRIRRIITIRHRHRHRRLTHSLGRQTIRRHNTRNTRISRRHSLIISRTLSTLRIRHTHSTLQSRRQILIRHRHRHHNRTTNSIQRIRQIRIGWWSRVSYCERGRGLFRHASYFWVSTHGVELHQHGDIKGLPLLCLGWSERDDTSIRIHRYLISSDAIREGAELKRCSCRLLLSSTSSLWIVKNRIARSCLTHSRIRILIIQVRGISQESISE